MKFARYLEETQVPEWKRAYLDYRDLKKRIAAIKVQLAARRQSHDGENGRDDTKRASSSVQISPDALGMDGKRHRPKLGSERSGSSTLAEDVTLSPRRPTISGTSGVTLPEGSFNPYRNSVYGRKEGPNYPHEMTFLSPIESASDLQVNELPNGGKAKPSSLDQFNSPLSPWVHRLSFNVDNTPVTPRRTRVLSFSGLSRKRPNSIAQPVRVPTTLAEVLETMSPLEVQFFEAMDRELDKVEAFYRDREKDALVRSALIKEQLNELKDHRKIFHAHQSGAILPKAIGKLASHLSPSSFGWKARREGAHNRLTTPDGNIPPTSRPGSSRQPSPQPKFDPEEYQNARKQLKRAVLEFYRGVEYLRDYRILNLTGFRKALKKFEKVTQIKVAQLYHNEKIEPSILSNSKTIDDMLDLVETLYAARFEGGDRKRAKSRLQASFEPRSDHSSTFRTGLFIGLSLPAMILGIYRVCQPHIQEKVPEWSSLLQIYLAFFIPVVFGLLVSLNNIVCARARINYIFIFELDVRTVMDCREYAELPAFLLMTLCYAFYFSFAGLQLKISPNYWPLTWLGLAALTLINPFPIFHPSSRWWILRKSGGLLLSGFRRVEFPDFFLGDQYCSMVYTLTTIYFMGCWYKSGFTTPWSDMWELLPWEFPCIVASLPSFIRIVQCIRRYSDSGEYIHLVNGGKYGSSILYSLFYYIWRNAGKDSRRDVNFVNWVLSASIMACYTTSWDIYMDWFLFQRGSKYPFLRKELIFENQIWVYYFAILTNTIIRFDWLLYIPIGGPDPHIRSGILGVLEALRRFQWNFFRLESEHLGNADQYQVTRDVPLPYTVDHVELEDDNGDEDDSARTSALPKNPFRLSLRKSLLNGQKSLDWQLHVPDPGV